MFLKLKNLKGLDLKGTYKLINVFFVSGACLYSQGVKKSADPEILIYT